MPRIARIVLVLLGLLVLTEAAGAQTDSTDLAIRDEILDGRRVVNVTDDVLRFWNVARGSSLPRARRLWSKMVESKHHEYFERAVYRNLDLEERRALLDEFLLRLPARIGSIRRFNAMGVDRIMDGLVAFKWRFPEYRQLTDVYLGVSLFRFDGSVRPVDNDSGVPDTLCLGAEVLAGYTDDQVRIAIVHELFHLYHFAFLFRQGPTITLVNPHTPLMVEGMAVAATEAVYPGRPPEMYLHFNEREFAAQQDNLRQNSLVFLDLMLEGAPPDKYESWFSIGPDAPPRGGYLLGYEVAKRLGAMYSFQEMVRMTVLQLREHAEEQLAAIAADRVLLMAIPEQR